MIKKNTNDKNDLQKKHAFEQSVRKLMEGINLFHGTNLTLNSDVDYDTYIMQTVAWYACCIQLFIALDYNFEFISKGSLTLAIGKCLWFSVKIKVCQSSLSSH